jgi:hypothetical protein
MTGVAFVLFTNYMITDPGTSPSKPRAQFIFGASVGLVYGTLMVFNVVYTLFFSVVIVCGARGAYWWMVHLRQKSAAKAKYVYQPKTQPTTTPGTEAAAA